METGSTKISHAAQRHEQQLVELYLILAAGKGETEEHYSISERLLESWNELNVEEQTLIRELAGDLADRFDFTELSHLRRDEERAKRWGKLGYHEAARILGPPGGSRLGEVEPRLAPVE